MLAYSMGTVIVQATDKDVLPLKVEFVELFRETVHDVLRVILGEKGARLVITFLQLNEHLHDLGEFYETFHYGLQPIFKEAVVTLERAIAKDLHRRARLRYREEEPFDFIKCVARAQERLLRLEARPEAKTHDRCNQSDWEGFNVA